MLESLGLIATAGFAKVSPRVLLNLERMRRRRSPSIADIGLRRGSQEGSLTYRLLSWDSGAGLARRSGTSVEDDVGLDGKRRGRLTRAAPPRFVSGLLLTANCIFNRRGALDNVQLVFLAGEIDVGQ
jgi:hypothetical protein